MNRTKKYIILIVIIFISTISFSQRLEYGTGLQITKVKGNTLIFPLNPQYNSDTTYLKAESTLFCFLFGGGINFPIFNITDEMSIGIQANVIVGAIAAKSENSLNAPGINLYTPAYLTYNFGAGSSFYSDMPVGFGLGIGYQFTLYMLGVASTGDDGLYYYHKPSLMLQVTDLWSFDNLLIRFETQLGGKKYIEKEYQNLAYGYSFVHSTISLIVYVNK